jgi:Fic family protein
LPHRPLYYELLNRVRTEGVWEIWLEYFLDAVIHTTHEAIASITRIYDIFEQDHARIQTLGRASASALKLFGYLQHKAMCTIPTVAKELGLTQPTVTSALERLAGLGIVAEVTGRQRDRIFSYHAYLAVLREGTE